MFTRSSNLFISCIMLIVIGAVQQVIAVEMEAGTWTQKADMPTARAIAGSAVVDGKIYVVGGAHVAWGANAVVEEYNPETDTWTRRADMPTSRQGVVAAAVDGIIYAIGGNSGLDAGDKDLSTVEAYDPATDTWSKKAEMPTARNVSAIAVVDRIIYVIGGIFGTPEDYQTGEDVAVLSTVEAYDPATDTWTTKAEMPTARGYYHAACVVDGRIYVFGGATKYGDLSEDFSCVPTVEVYDPATDTWTQVSDMPWARHGHTASVVDGKVYIIGGLDDEVVKLFLEGKIELDKVLELFSTVDVYNPATDMWTTAPALPNGRKGPTAAVVEGKIYIIGGYWGPEGTKLSTVEEYAPDLRDFSNVFFMSLQSGLNMISLPLEPRTPYTARSFAESLSATVVIKLDEARQRFVGFTLDAPDDGFAVEGGKGYIVNMPGSRVVAFTGTAWANQPPVEASPSLAPTDGAWAFVVSGRFEDDSQTSEVSEDFGSFYLVTVRNTRTNAVATDVVRSRYFAAAFADLNRQNVVQTGDRLEVQVRNKAGEMVSDTVSYTVTADAILKAYLPLTLKNSEIPLKSLWNIPTKTGLLQNYPNPFNPETWIPYQIRESEEVVIRIYNSAGRLVRTLDLGQREAGFYLGRSRAAYWDGKNDSREPVSSGLYFYQLQAGDFSATRKMVIVK